MAPREGPKCPLACNYCRVKKAKCDGCRPCSNCTSHNETCVYAPPPQRARKRALETQSVLDRVERMETLFRASMSNRATDKESGTSSQPLLDSTSSHQIAPQPGHDQYMPTSESCVLRQTDVSRTSPVVATGLSTATESIHGSALNLDMSYNLMPTPAASHETVADCSGSNEFSNTNVITREPTHILHTDALQIPTPNTCPEESVVSPQISNAEHHGPVSYLSICSNPAMRWISQAANAPEYAFSASTFSMDTTRTLKMDRKISDIRAMEPDYFTAQTYANAYFQHSVEAAFAVVDESQFRARLEAHFGSEPKLDDPEWYALRNAVYAAGCKVHMVQTSPTKPFESSQNASWRYFENAMSVHTELVYMRSGLMAIQALTTMAFYTEGLGNPALEYMLISNAVRLAQSKGLHRQPSETWSIPKRELRFRRWLFWVIYAYDKHISYRSGRPTAIDDDDISCDIPDVSEYSDIANVTFVLQVINHARISSQISRDLTSVKSSKEKPDILAQRARKLESDLDEWRKSIAPDLRPGVPFGHGTNSGPNLYHALYLHFAYYGSLIAIHSIFAYPWYLSSHAGSKGQIFDRQVATSTTTLIEASRQIVLAVKYIDVRKPWPAWLVFFYPLLGLINIFIYILKYLNSHSVPSDLALMDIVAGHFGYLEYYSASRLSFPFVGELTGIARAAVKRAKGKETSGSCSTQNTNQDNVAVNTQADRQEFTLNEVRAAPQSSDESTDLFYQFTNNDNFDFALGNWPSFMPSMSHVSSIAADCFLVDDPDSSFML